MELSPFVVSDLHLGAYAKKNGVSFESRTTYKKTLSKLEDKMPPMVPLSLLTAVKLFNWGPGPGSISDNFANANKLWVEATVVISQTIDGHRILSYYLMVVSKFYRDKLQHAIDPKIEKTITESLVKQFTDDEKGMYHDATCICDNYRRNGVPDLEPDWSEFIQADERDAAPTHDTVFTIGPLKPTQPKTKFTPMPDPHGASTVTQKKLWTFPQQ